VEFFEEFLFGDPRCGTGSHYCVLKDEEGRVLYDSQEDVPLGWRIGSENVTPDGEPPRRKAPNRGSVKLGGKYVTRGIELTVTTKTDTANGGKSVSFCSEDGCTKGFIWFRDEVVTREKIQARLDARRLATCSGCGRPYLSDAERFTSCLTNCKACQAVAWEASAVKGAQEREAVRQEALDASRKFWETEAVAPLPWLVALRDEVMRRNPKRCPKWGFNLAPDLDVPDLVVQLQPRPTLAEWPRRHAQPLYLGVCLFDPKGVAKGVFHDGREKEDERPGRARLKFELGDGGAAGWLFRPTRWKARRGDGSQRVDWLALRRRLLEEMPARLDKFAPDIMLSSHCLLCGKTLTDPASMARWIGPECASSGALTVPGLDRDAAAAGLAAWLR
jgi:hypothetical protein